MPCSSPFMGKRSSVLTPQPSRKTTIACHRSRSSSSISSIRLPSYRVPCCAHRFVDTTLSNLHNSYTYHLLDIKADNIMFGTNDDSVFTHFEEYELQKPVPRKEVGPDGRTIYMSQELKIPNQIGFPILCDFGSTVHGAQHHSVFIQPQIYRAPEVILGIPWTFSADIWNVGCMVSILPGPGRWCQDSLIAPDSRSGISTKAGPYSQATTLNSNDTAAERISLR